MSKPDPENNEEASQDASLKPTRIWDLPTRLFHWALAATVMTGWYYGEYREFSTIEWHFYLGYCTAGLLIFRLFWGFYGPPSAQFRNIFPTRGAIFAYLKNIMARKPSGVAGHNPIGGLSIAAILIVLSVQIITGFYAEDDGLFASGPLSAKAPTEWVLFANQIHHYSSRVIFVLVGLHLAAILFYYFWKRENLIRPMITGDKLTKK